MGAARLNRLSALVPLLCSALAFAIVMTNIVLRVPPQADENASAHLFQLLIAGQLPFVALFAATSDWHHWRPAARLLGLQFLAVAAALAPVLAAGY